MQQILGGGLGLYFHHFYAYGFFRKYQANAMRSGIVGPRIENHANG